MMSFLVVCQLPLPTWGTDVCISRKRVVYQNSNGELTAKKLSEK